MSDNMDNMMYMNQGTSNVAGVSPGVLYDIYRILHDTGNHNLDAIGGMAAAAGDTLKEVGKQGQEQEISNPFAPILNAAGTTLNIAGAGLDKLGDVISDEGQKNIGVGIQDILSYLFTEYLKSPEFTSYIKPYRDVYITSDFNKKILQQYANREEPLTERELAVVSYLMGKGDGELDPTESGDWTDDMVQEYADNLRNFLYTYKESAKEVDPSIDPSEYHRGPMAQDIEKVAPDCVKETEQGVKVVDGNRLALVNAGVIGDLARRLIELEDKVYG